MEEIAVRMGVPRELFHYEEGLLEFEEKIADAEAEIALLKAKDVEHTTAINNLQTELTNVKVTAEAAKKKIGMLLSMESAADTSSYASENQ